jgi:hypothetical protein
MTVFLKPALAAVVVACSIGSANATMFARDLDSTLPGYEGVYDDVHNVTWLADATAGGLLTYSQSRTWASGLEVGAYDGWRIAHGSELWTNFDSWLTASRSEFGFYFWDEPGGRANGGVGADTGMGSRLFKNAWVPYGYLGEQLPYYDHPMIDVYYFDWMIPDVGCCADDTWALGAWAVHEGDIGVAPVAVPAPETYALMGLGLLAVAGARRLRSKQGKPAIVQIV